MCALVLLHLSMNGELLSQIPVSTWETRGKPRTRRQDSSSCRWADPGSFQGTGAHPRFETYGFGFHQSFLSTKPCPVTVWFVELSLSVTFCPPTEFLWNWMFAETKMDFPKGYGWGAGTNIPMYGSDWDTHLFPPCPWAFPIFHTSTKCQLPFPTSTLWKSAESFWILHSVNKKNFFCSFHNF